MNNKLFITNKTAEPMLATISDNSTGNNVLSYELHEGTNEIPLASLDNGVYMITLFDGNNDIFYKQQLIKD